MFHWIIGSCGLSLKLFFSDQNNAQDLPMTSSTIPEEFCSKKSLDTWLHRGVPEASQTVLASDLDSIPGSPLYPMCLL